ncbi:translocation/assembly module TamB domain-containing protein [Mesorhizobium sp. SP-1A]|uniref:translocation/assembly module TamB domain-containing protein n=1 Tax=Mesorhizobium sp. SP-1A TaxID=3077840 RepID=UPI0028F72818|nr:translocation/assembly module TamB domain-containing protein [Mesorhizobium sp. SP-1A]
MMRIVRRVMRVLFYLVLVVAAAGLGALVVLTTPERGRENLAGIISSLASSPERKVEIGGISGIWSGALRLDHVVVADKAGPWLVLRNVAVDWSPTALLGKTFRAERVAAGRIELARLPQQEPQKRVEQPSGSFTLPISVDIQQIDLPDIALGEALAGAGIAELAAKGTLSAKASPLAIATDLDVSRRDGKQGNVTAKVHFAPADNRLDLDVKASEPDGGILANLLKLPGAPAVDITLAGSGPLADWNGTGNFSIDGQVVTQISGRHQFTDKGNRIEVKGDGDFARFVPERVKPLLAGKVDFDMAGTATSAGGVEIEHATVQSSALHGAAKGSINPAGASDFALEFTSVGPTLPLSFGSKESPIDIDLKSASLRALGEGRSPAVDIAVTATKVATNVTKVENLAVALHSDAFDIESRTGPISGTATAEKIGLDNPTVAPLIAGKVATKVVGKLEKDKIVVDSGSIQSDALKGGFDGSVSLADGSIELNVKADAASAALPAPARPVLGERTVLSAALKRDSGGNVSADSVELSSGAVSASGTARLSDGQFTADLKGALADLSLLSKDARGAINLSVQAQGAMAAPDVSLTVESGKLSVANREITGLKLDAQGRMDIANPAATVSLTGDVAGQPLKGNAVLKTADGRREVQGLALSLGQNQVSGDLTLDEAFLPDGTVTFKLPDIGPLAALALEKAEGDVNGTVRFYKESGVPQVALKAAAGSIRRGELSVKKATVDALVANYAAAPAISGTIRADGVTSGGTAITGIAVDLKRDGDWTAFSGGATVKDIPARAEGRVKLADGTTTVELKSGQATFRGVKAAISQASTITIANGVTQLDKLAVGIGGGTATVSGTAGEKLDLDVRLSSVPVSVANGFAPGLDAAGTVSGTVKVSGAAANPAVAFDINGSGIQTSQTRGAGLRAFGVKSSGNFASNKLNLDANLSEGSGLALKIGGSVTTAGTPQLGLDINGAVPFGFLAGKLAEQGLSLSGTANVAMQVRGAATQPVIGGTVRTSGARFVDAKSGLAVNNLQAEVTMGNGVATISRLTGTLSTRGTLSASGTVGIDPAKGFPADLSIKLVDGRYTDGSVVTANLSGDLAIKGPLTSAAVISGTVNLARTVITVPDKLPGSLSALDVKHKNAPAAVRAQDRALNPSQGAKSGGNGGGLGLDITVRAPNQIFVQGRGLDAELGGTLKLTGPASSPQAVGQFTLQRGRLALLGKRLTFTEGTLTFAGSLVPYLNMTAQSSANDATVTVTVVGDATNPKFNFSSVPALPEDEVLARLIFGRAMSSLSPLQIAQLADAAATLAGAGGSSSLLNKLRNGLGVDDLDVTTDEKGGTSVSAGKYLNDRTYLSIQKGDKPGSGKARIDLDVGRGLKLRGEASDAGEAKGGIFYEKEY